MFDDIIKSGDTIEQFVAKVKNKSDGARLMGFGHRVYKNFDPRGTVIKKATDEVITALGLSSELFDMAKHLEQIALNDEYFIERKLYPNVDFYSGLIYKAMGFPTPMFTPLFALGRIPGWIAHWREMMADPTTKIGRPRQVYIGEVKREYVPIGERGQ
jgi:citrate synthase